MRPVACGKCEPPWVIFTSRRKKWAQGEVVVIRFADDNILGFQYQTDADRFLENLQTDADRFLETLRERLAKFGPELHPEKTRRIEVGRFAEENRKRIRSHGMRPLDIERGFLRPATTCPRLRTARKYLPETSVGFRAGWQLKFSGEHAQIIFCRRVVKSVYDCNDSSATGRGHLVYSSNRRRGFPRRRGAREQKSTD